MLLSQGLDIRDGQKSDLNLNQPGEQAKLVEMPHNLEPHQLLLVGIIGTFTTLIAFVFCTFAQALSFGLLTSIFAYSLILTFMERADQSTWKSVNHWDDGEQKPPIGQEALDSNLVQAQAELTEGK